MNEENDEGLAGLTARRHHRDRWWPCVGTLISCRRTRGWGYDSGVGRLSKSPLVAVVVLGTYTVINSISTQFSIKP